MKLIGLVFSSFLLMASSAVGQTPAPTPVSGKIQWVFDLEEAKQLAKEQDKPIFAVFRCER